MTADEIDAIHAYNTDARVTETVNIRVTSVIEPPTLSGISTTPLNYTEGDTPLIVASNAKVEDEDHTHLDSATVTISKNFISGEDFLRFSPQPGITGWYDWTSGKLTLDGPATLADFQAVLRTVTYDNHSEFPTELSREITFVVNDGEASSNTLSQEIVFTAVNDVPTFAPQFTRSEITTSAKGASSVFTADIDNDGDLDVLATAKSDNSVAWYENNGNGSFTAHAVATNATQTQTGTAADIDSDGDQDLLIGTENSLVWYENDGNQNFTEQSLGNTFAVVRSVTTADMDNDGDIDLLAGIRDDNTVAWFENDGSQNFIRHNISTTAVHVKAVTTVDMDGDGDLDVLSANRFANGGVVWYENDGAQSFAPHTILATRGAQDVTTADMDGDGDIDVLSGSYLNNTIAWHENDGNQSFTEHQIDSGDSSSQTVSTADIDGDGDMDVVTAVNNSRNLTWYENDSSQSFTDHTITTAAFRSTDVTTGDFNGDGHLDILSSSAGMNTVAWYENPGSYVTTLDGNPSFTEGSTPVVLDSDVEIFDHELSSLNNFDGASLTLARTGGANTEDVFAGSGNLILNAGSIELSSTPIGTYTNSNGLLTMVFGPSATASLVNEALQSITYENTNDTPPASVTIEWSFHDNNSGAQGIEDLLMPTGITATGNTIVDIIAVNDPPELSNLEALPELYTENEPPLPITSSLSLTDADDININAATVTISANFAPGEDELNITVPPDITAVYNAATGVLSLSGSASINDYQAALRTVTYHNTSNDPSDAPRTVRFEINDGIDSSKALSRFIEIGVVNDMPVLDLTEITPAAYTENDAPLNITDNTVVSDVDNVNLNQATVSITNFVTGEDILDFTDQAGIAGNFDTNTGILSLSGSATVGEYQTALRSVTYHNTSDNPSDLTRSITLAVGDGDKYSNKASRDIAFTAVNDAPDISTIEAVPAQFTENESPVVITGNLSLADVDDASIESATVTITGDFVAGEDELIFTDQPPITGNFDPLTGKLSLIGSAPVADYQAAIQTITYNNISNNPSTVNRTVSFEIFDGDDTSNTLSRDIEVTAVNDAPALSATESMPAAYTENDAPLNITTSTIVSDVDDINIESAAISITSNFVSGEDILEFTDQSGIAGTFDSNNGILSLIGTASAGDYQTALRSVTYHNTSDNPSDLTRTISFEINDGDTSSDSIDRDITFTAVNDAPVVANSTATTNEDTPHVIAFSDLPFSDIENHNLLEVIVNPTDTKLTVDNVAQTLTYTPTSDFNGTDSVSYQVKDDGGTDNNGADSSTTATIDFTVTPVNDSPVSSDTSLADVPEDSAPSGELISSLVGPVFTDIDSGNTLKGIAITANTQSVLQGSWQYQDTTGGWQNIGVVDSSNALLLDKTTSIRFMPGENFNGTPQPLKVHAIDSSYSGTLPDIANVQSTGGNTPFSNQFDISTTVTAVNDAPLIADVALAPHAEDTGATIPMQIIDLFSAQYSDADGTAAMSGIAVTANPAIADEGSWQYSTNGSDWFDIDTVSSTDALLLHRDAYIRFSPATHFHGEPADLSLRAVDGTYTGSFSADNNRIPFDVTTAGTMVSTEHAITISIVPVNDEPAGSDLTIELSEDSQHFFNVTEFGFSDPADLDSFSGITVKSLPVNGALLLAGDPVGNNDFISAAALNGSSFSYAPDRHYHGTDSWEFVVSDDGGTANNGIDQDQSNNRVAIDILSVNDAPSGSDATLSTDESTPIDITLADLTFTDQADQDNIKSIIIESLPLSGTLLIDQTPVAQNDIINASDIANGMLTFVPAPVEVASTAVFSFRVIDDGGTDNNGIDTAATANNVTINIVTDNNPPTGRDNTIELNEDSTISLDSAVFGFSDTADGHSLAGVIISAHSPSGTLLHNGSTIGSDTFIAIEDLDAGLLSFTPAPDESGSGYASILFKVVDNGKTTSGKHISTDDNTLTLNVNPVNDAPTQLNLEGAHELEENTTADSIGDLVFTDADDNDTHQFSVSDDRFEVVDGVLSLKPGTTLDYESEQTVPLQITVTDSAGATAIHDITLQVINVNEAPVLSQQTENQTSTAPFSFTLPPAAFTDIDGDSLTLVAALGDGTPLPEWLKFEQGMFTIMENAPAGSVDVLVTATDPDGLNANTPLTISIEPTPEPEPAMEAALPTFTTIVPDTTPAVISSEVEPEPEVTTAAEEPNNQVDRNSLEPPAEQFDASDISISAASTIDEQQLKEVVQLDSQTSQVTALLNTRDDIGIALANNFEVLLTATNYETEETRQQTALNLSALKKLASESDKSQTVIANSQVLSTKVLASSVTLTSSFSVGYILWLLRGGTLLASVMASMPAWRTIDPLPVLESLTGDDDGDTETLESMVEEEPESADDANSQNGDDSQHHTGKAA